MDARRALSWHDEKVHWCILRSTDNIYNTIYLHRPVLSKKVHFITPQKPRHLSMFGSHRQNWGEQPALNQTIHTIDSLCSMLVATKDIRLCNHASSIYTLLTTHATRGLQRGNTIFLCALLNKFSVPGRGSASTRYIVAVEKRVQGVSDTMHPCGIRIPGKYRTPWSVYYHHSHRPLPHGDTHPQS